MAVVTMIAGPNGSGKSTLIAKLIGRGLLAGEYLNADDIALNLEGDPESVAGQAQIIVRQRREAAIREGRDYCFETVMSHTSHIDHFREARASGYRTRLYFIATEGPTINVSRVANRVANGGHNVPTDRIEARYFRTLANLPAAIGAADYAMILDNSLVDQPLRQLAEISDGFITILHNQVDTIPFWWLKILHTLRPPPLLENGPLLLP